MSDKPEPQDVQSEEALLGAILVSPATAKKIELDADAFYRPRNGLIWAAAIKCSRNGGADAITVAAELERRGQLEECGGPARLARLAATVPVAANAGAYARRVKETAELRRVRRLALTIIQSVDAGNLDGFAETMREFGNPILYVDTRSGEVIDECPTCTEKEKLLEKKEHRERSLLSQVSRLEGKAEKKAREHKLWPEIAACFDIYKLATGYFQDVTFTVEEFNQALPRWKQYGKGKANPCKPALKAICGIAYDPTPTRGRNKKQRVYNKWELLNRNQFSWPDFHERVPGETDADWWRCLMGMIEANLQ